MPELDNRTILFVSSGIYLILAGTMAVASVLLKKYRGPVYWAIGACGWSLFTSLLYLQGWISPWITLILPNVPVIVSLCFVSHGLVVFLGERQRLWFYMAACLLSLIGSVYFRVFHNSFQARVVIASLTQSVILGDLVLLLFKKQKYHKEPSYLFALFSCLVPALVYAVRAIVASVVPAPHDLLQAQWFFSSTLVFYPLSAIVLCLSFILLASSRFARELEQGRLQLLETNQQLSEALANVKTLSGLLPICANCKKIRDDQGYWQQIETYIRDRSAATFTHSICPTCAEKLYSQVSPGSHGDRKQ
jgi:hypothetical protein